MFQKSSPALLKWMKPILEVNGRTNEDPYAISDLNKDEVQQSNRYSGSSAAMVRSGPRLSKTLERIHFNLLSNKKLQQVLRSVLISGKHILVSRHEDMFIVSSIMVKNNTQTEKEIILMVLRDFWGI